MAALRHVHVGSKARWMNLFAGQSSIGHFNETKRTESVLNTIQKRCFHPANVKNFHATGTQSRLLSAGLISSQYGVGPTWSMISAQRQRYNSTDAAKTTYDAAGYIVEPPSLPPVVDISDVSQTVNALVEPSLASMGLGSYWPTGLYQQGLEFLHINAGMPWWEAIVVSVVIVRVLSIPLLIKSQQAMANSHNHMPAMTKLQEKLAEAKLYEQHEEHARTQMEMQNYMKKNNTNPIKTMMFPLLQAPIFISVFIGLKKMASYPVESMTSGGLWWFSDLTVTDPYFILPFLTCSTILLTLEVGSEGISSRSTSTSKKYLMRAMPCIMFPVMAYFPVALNGYWLTSNLCGLLLTTLLRQQYIRKMCKIPVKIVHPVKEEDKKPMKQFFKDAWADSKRKQRVKQNMKSKADNFKKAGTGPLTKTYATDPTLKKTLPQKVHRLRH